MGPVLTHRRNSPLKITQQLCTGTTILPILYQVFLHVFHATTLEQQVTVTFCIEASTGGRKTMKLHSIQKMCIE